jgi:hypothetical protein
MTKLIYIKNSIFYTWHNERNSWWLKLPSLNLLDVERFESPEILKNWRLAVDDLQLKILKRVLIGNTKAPTDYKAHSNVDEEGLMKANS